MAPDQGGEASERQDVPANGDANVTAHDLRARQMQVPVSGSFGVQVGEGNTQVNNYFIGGGPQAPLAAAQTGDAGITQTLDSAAQPADAFSAGAAGDQKSPDRFLVRRTLALGAFAAVLAIALASVLGAHGGVGRQAGGSGSRPTQQQPSVSSVSGSSGTAPATEFTVCTTPALTCRNSNATGLKTEPTGIVNSVDGAAYIENLTWANWGSASAKGTGTLVGDDCLPACIYGHDTTYAVTVTLTRLVSYGNGEQAYSSMVISVPSAPSRSEKLSTYLVP